MNRIIFFSAAATTALLSAGFILLTRSAPKTVYSAKAGTLMSSPSQPPETQSATILGLPAPKPLKLKTPKPAPQKKQEDSQDKTQRRKSAAAQKPSQARTQQKDKKTISSATLQRPEHAAGEDSGDEDILPRYVTLDIIDRFEKDPSKYILKEYAENHDLILRLIALENLEKMIVLKVAVENKSKADFFVKGFEAWNGGHRLEERSLFKILVEAGKTREGYVLIGKPRKGAGISVKLLEEGGEKRVLDLPVNCPL